MTQVIIFMEGQCSVVCKCYIFIIYLFIYTNPDCKIRYNVLCCYKYRNGYITVIGCLQSYASLQNLFLMSIANIFEIQSIQFSALIKQQNSFCYLPKIIIIIDLHIMKSKLKNVKIHTKFLNLAEIEFKHEPLFYTLQTHTKKEYHASLLLLRIYNLMLCLQESLTGYLLSG